MTRSTLILITTVILTTVVCKAGNNTLDLSAVPVTPELQSLLHNQLPSDIANWLDEMELPSRSLINYFYCLEFMEASHDEGKDTLVAIYYSAGGGVGEVQLLRRQGASFVFLDKSRAVQGGARVGLDAMDVDCDGKYELVTSCLWGARGGMSMSAFAIDNGKLAPLTPVSRDSLLTGLYIEAVDRDSNCVKEIEVQTPQRGGFAPDSVRVYELNTQTRKFVHMNTKEYKSTVLQREN